MVGCGPVWFVRLRYENNWCLAAAVVAVVELADVSLTPRPKNPGPGADSVRFGRVQFLLLADDGRCIGIHTCIRGMGAEAVALLSWTTDHMAAESASDRACVEH